MTQPLARTQRFPRNLMPILAGFLAVLVGGGLLYTAFHRKDATEETAPQAAIRPGHAENILARAQQQERAASGLPASPGLAVPGTVSTTPLPVPIPGENFRLPGGGPVANYRLPTGTPAPSSLPSTNGLPGTPAASPAPSNVDAYAQRKEEARTATASLAAYEEFDTATKPAAVALPEADTLAAVEKSLSGLTYPAQLAATGSAGTAEGTAALLQRALQAAQGAQGGSAGTARKQDSWAKDQHAVADVDPPLTATDAPSPWMLFQGTVIPAVLVTPVTSDAPGSITARVTRDVFDDVRAQRLLIPKGARLYGTYMNEVGAGQDRVLMAFSRLIYPDGKSVRLSGFGGGDAMGRSGVPAEVNNHFWQMFGAGFLIAGVSKAFERSSSQANVTVINQGGGSTTLMDAAGQILTDTARKMLERNQNISPTLNLAEGFKFNVIVNRDMALSPYTAL